MATRKEKERRNSYYSPPSLSNLPSGVYVNIRDRTSAEKMTPQAWSILDSAKAAASAVGIPRLDVVAARGPGHKSHQKGTEWDLVGYDANGKKWTNAQRVAVAQGARQSGANRFGLYNMTAGLGRGTLHVGYSGQGRPEAIWGAGGQTGGLRARLFGNPDELAFRDAFQAGAPYQIPQGLLDTARENQVHQAHLGIPAGISAPDAVAGIFDQPSPLASPLGPPQPLTGLGATAASPPSPPTSATAGPPPINPLAGLSGTAQPGMPALPSAAATGNAPSINPLLNVQGGATALPNPTASAAGNAPRISQAPLGPPPAAPNPLDVKRAEIGALASGMISRNPGNAANITKLMNDHGLNVDGSPLAPKAPVTPLATGPTLGGPGTFPSAGTPGTPPAPGMPARGVAQGSLPPIPSGAATAQKPLSMAPAPISMPQATTPPQQTPQSSVAIEAASPFQAVPPPASLSPVGPSQSLIGRPVPAMGPPAPDTTGAFSSPFGMGAGMPAPPAQRMAAQSGPAPYTPPRGPQQFGPPMSAAPPLNLKAPPPNIAGIPSFPGKEQDDLGIGAPKPPQAIGPLSVPTTRFGPPQGPFVDRTLAMGTPLPPTQNPPPAVAPPTVPRSVPPVPLGPPPIAPQIHLAGEPKSASKSKTKQVVHTVLHPLNAVTGIPTAAQLATTAMQSNQIGRVFNPQTGEWQSSGNGFGGAGFGGGYGWGGWGMGGMYGGAGGGNINQGIGGAFRSR